MKLQDLILPALALGAAALLIGPAEESYGFTKNGRSLGIAQRDVRLFNNFADPQANDNVSQDPNWPGWDGAELAIWKGVAEWASLPHGDGSGDPTQPAVGSSGVNFDGAWMGSASVVGNTNDNIVSALASGGSCGGVGVLAYTEFPAMGNGWRIRFCDMFDWADGPAGILATEYDIQGVMAHEYGHALGLGHTGVANATMRASVAAGTTTQRSIEADDIFGIQCIYGVAVFSKPTITATQGLGTTVNIFGTNFDPTSNDVWFTNATVTANSVDPRVIVSGVPSSGGMISVAIPTDAGPGDVFVRVPGSTAGEFLSNGFPWEANATFGNGLGFPNTLLPAELGSDPVLADIGGDTGVGPKFNDPTEPFALSLDCSGASAPGVYTMVIRTGHLGAPAGSAFGDFWLSGAALLKTSGVHSQNAVSWGPTTLPNDPSLVGVEYAVQGYCGQPGGGRLSSGIVQTIGSP